VVGNLLLGDVGSLPGYTHILSDVSEDFLMAVGKLMRLFCAVVCTPRSTILCGSAGVTYHVEYTHMV